MAFRHIASASSYLARKERRAIGCNGLELPRLRGCGNGFRVPAHFRNVIRPPDVPGAAARARLP